MGTSEAISPVTCMLSEADNYVTFVCEQSKAKIIYEKVFCLEQSGDKVIGEDAFGRFPPGSVPSSCMRALSPKPV